VWVLLAARAVGRKRARLVGWLMGTKTAT